MEFMQYNIVKESSSTIRALARQALSGKWTESFLTLLLTVVIQNVPGAILSAISPNGFLGTVGTFYSLVIAGPLNLGIAYYFVRLFRQQSGGMHDLRFGFDYISRAISLYLMIVIKTFLWSLLFVIPGIIASFRYAMAMFILADDPNKFPAQCIAESSMMMRGNKMNYFILGLSFFGWMFLAAIPQGFVEISLMGGFSRIDPETVYESARAVANNPMVLLSSVPTLIVSAYQNTAYAAFYDLANGNLSVGGFDYAAAAGRVEDPYTGEKVSFTDVPTEVRPQEDDPSIFDKPFEDPELKDLEDKYTGESDE